MTVTTTTKPVVTAPAFPKATIEVKLKEVLLEAAQSEAALKDKGVTLPADTAGQAARPCGSTPSMWCRSYAKSSPS